MLCAAPRAARRSSRREWPPHCSGGFPCSPPTRPIPLPPVKLEIARLVDGGMSNKLIAARLCIEVSTVKNHMHRILAKLHAQHRAEIPRRLRAAHEASDEAWTSLRR
jgi:DNA-binding NarL/FixJ family response regulator